MIKEYLQGVYCEANISFFFNPAIHTMVSSCYSLKMSVNMWGKVSDIMIMRLNLHPIQWVISSFYQQKGHTLLCNTILNVNPIETGYFPLYAHSCMLFLLDFICLRTFSITKRLK